MTTEEHQLLIAMFQRQTFALKSLLEVLKSQEIVKEGDLAAYDALICSNNKVRSSLEAQVEEDYQATAEAFGVETGIPRFPMNH